MATTEKKTKAPAEPKKTRKAAAVTIEQVEIKAAPRAKKAPKKASGDAFAVLATGGKQYLVFPGQSLKIEKIKGEFKEGDTLTFDNILLSANGSASEFGTPFIKGSSVSATLKKIGRYKTIDVIKYKQKSRYFKKNGHRQPYFEVVIDSIK